MPKTECEEMKKKRRGRGSRRQTDRQTDREAEGTQKCGPPGLDADTGEGLLRGGAGPYGCMAKWNPRGGGGHISLHGALHRFLCTAVCGTRRNIDNDIRLPHLCDGSWIPHDTAGAGPAAGKKKKNGLPHPASKELLMLLNNDPGTAAKNNNGGGDGRRPAAARRLLSNNRGESHNSTAFHTKSATVVKSISHYL